MRYGMYMAASGGGAGGQGAQDITVTIRRAHDGAGKPAGNKN